MVESLPRIQSRQSRTCEPTVVDPPEPIWSADPGTLPEPTVVDLSEPTVVDLPEPTWSAELQSRPRDPSRADHGGPS